MISGLPQQFQNLRMSSSFGVYQKVIGQIQDSNHSQ